MEQFGPEHFGRILLFIGLIVALIGLVVILLGHIGLFHLPGDLEFGGRNWKVYIPIASCIIISAVLTLLFWLISLFRR